MARAFVFWLSVLLLALEARASGRILCVHIARARLVAQAADVMAECMAGQGGKSAHARLFGKTVHEEALEFGEGLWWRPPRTTSYNALMEPRWRAGVWLGRKWGPRLT